MSSKKNLKQILQTIKIQIDYPQLVKEYFKNIFFDLTNNHESLSIFQFRRYLQLPYLVSRKIFFLFDTENLNYLNVDNFCNGITHMYLSEQENEKIQILFELFDFDNDGYINKNDIFCVLKHFHMIKNETDIKLLYDLLENAFNCVEKENEKDKNNINIEEWKNLNKINSDILVLTLFYLYVNKPFYVENINYFISNFCDIKSIPKNKEIILDKSLLYVLADSTKYLYDYINENFKEQFEYVDVDELSNNSLEDLNDFDYDKNLFLQLVENNVLNHGNIVDNKIKKEKYECIKQYNKINHLITKSNNGSFITDNSNFFNNNRDDSINNKLNNININFNLIEDDLNSKFSINDNYQIQNNHLSNNNTSKFTSKITSKVSTINERILVDDVDKSNQDFLTSFDNKNKSEEILKDTKSTNADTKSNIYVTNKSINTKFNNTTKTINSNNLNNIPEFNNNMKKKLLEIEKKDCVNNSFSYFHYLRYEIEAYHSLFESKEFNINSLNKYLLIFLNDEIFIIEPKEYKFVKIINLKNCFITRNKEEVKTNGKTYYSFLINSYNLDEYDIRSQSSFNFSSFLSSEIITNNDRKSSSSNMGMIQKLFFVDDEKSFVKFFSHLNMSFKEKSIFDYYTYKEEIGKGAFGKVFRATKKNQNDNLQNSEYVDNDSSPQEKCYAIKQLKKSDIHFSDLVYLSWELDIFNFLRYQKCDYIVKAYEKFEDVNYIYLIYDYIKFGTLSRLRKKTTLSLNALVEIALQLLLALRYLKSFGIIHRDIKPDNILISKRSSPQEPNQNSLNAFTLSTSKSISEVIRIKLIDFGLSKVLTSNEYTKETCGSLVYIAPEVLCKKKYDFQADIWSFGMTLYYAKFGKLPFNGRESVVLDYYQSIKFNGFHEYLEQFEDNSSHMFGLHKNLNNNSNNGSFNSKFKCIANLHKDETINSFDIISEIIEKCIVYNPAKRATVDELIEYIDNYESVLKKNTIKTNI